MKEYNISKIGPRQMVILCLLTLVLVLGACKKTMIHPDLDVTFIPQKGNFISKTGDRLDMAAIIEMTRDKDYILIGEGHKNPIDHKVQQRVLSALAASENGPSIGLEMIAADMQPVLNDFGKGLVSVDDLEEELQWDTKWGYPYKHFRPLFEIANRNSLPVAGLNVPTRITKKISKEGKDSLTEEERIFLPTVIVPPSMEQIELLDMIYAQHEGKDEDNATQRERFHLVQSIWDSKMAEEAVKLHNEYGWPTLIIAGAGHVEYDWGIARRIRRLDPDARILSIMPWRGGKFDPTSGDVFFYSPDTYESRMGASLTALGQGGILVEAVKRDSRAAKAGLRPGDVLIEASGVQLDYLFSLHRAGSKVYKAGEELIFTVRRGTDTFTANVGKLGVPKPKKPTQEPGADNATDPQSTPNQTMPEQE